VVVNENVLDHDESVQVSCLRGNGSSLRTSTRLTMISPMLMFRAHDATTNQTWAAERHSLRLVKKLLEVRGLLLSPTVRSTPLIALSRAPDNSEPVEFSVDFHFLRSKDEKDTNVNDYVRQAKAIDC